MVRTKLAALLLLIVTLSLAVPLSVASAANASTSPPRFILLTPFADYAFFETIKKGMADAAQSLGVEATFSGTPDGNMQALAVKVREATKAGYDGIALNIVDPVALDEAVADAINQGVPVIAFNVDDNRTANARLAAVGQNMLEAGRSFGREVAGFVPEGSHVLLTMHDPNITALEERAAGMQESLKAKNLTWTSLITGTEPQAALEKIRAVLKADPRIKIVLSTGSADTEASGRTIETHFSGKGYIAAGFDLSPEILRLVKAGVIRMTVDQQPYAQGYYAVVALTFLKRYGLAPSNVDTGAAMIDAAKADQIIELSKQHYR